MAAQIGPWEAATQPQLAQRLWVLGLIGTPPVPYDLAAVLGYQQATAPARLAYTGPPTVLIADCLAQLSGTFQLAYPAGKQGAFPVAAVALVIDNPPSGVVAVQVMPSTQWLRQPGDVILGAIDLTAAQVALV